MSVTIKLRRGTSLEWTNSSPNVVLSLGEPGFETDTHKLKIGDGTTAWNSLDYVSDGFSGVGGPLDYTYEVDGDINSFVANNPSTITNLNINPISHNVDFSPYYDDLIDNSYSINITLTKVEDADKAILFSCQNITDMTGGAHPYYSFDVAELSRSTLFTGFETDKKYYLNIDIKGQNFPELTEDKIDSLIVAGSGINKNYDDAADPATLTISVSGLDSSYISDFSIAVSGLLPVVDVVQGSGINVTSSSGTFTVGVSGLNASYISDFSSSVSGLLPVVDVVQGSGINVTSSSGTFTVGVSGLNASYISDFNESVDDRVDDLLIAGAAISLDYVDASGTLTISAINEVALDSQEPNGFIDRLDCTISTSGNVFSISPTGSSYQVYIQGVKFTKNATETFTIPSGVTGPNYVHFNITTGDLDNKTTPFNFSTDIPVAYIVWNSTSQSVIYFGDERHGIHMDKATHLYLHNTQGTQYISGLSISNYVLDGNGSSNTHASIGIGGGVIYDEDLVIDITNGSGGEPFHQVLSPSGSIPVYYHDGAVGSWAISTNSYPLKYSANGAQYNKLNGTWTAADATTNNSTRYISMFLCASNNVHAPVFAIMGQAVHTTQPLAESNDTWASLDLTYLPANEMKPIYRLTYATDRDWTNIPKSSLVAILDLRSQALAMGGLTQNDHGSLYGLADDDHLQYVHIDNARTISANHTFSSGLTASGTISAASGTFTSLSVSGTGVALSGHSHTASNISDFSSAVSGLLPVVNVVQGSGVSVTSSSGTFTVSASGIASFTQLYPTVMNLGDVSSTVSTDADTGQIFDVRLTGNVTLSNPTNPTNGVTLRWRIKQDGSGGRAVTLDTTFQIPSSATSPLPFSTAPDTTDLLAATYNSATDKWDIIAFVMGY